MGAQEVCKMERSVSPRTLAEIYAKRVVIVDANRGAVEKVLD